MEEIWKDVIGYEWLYQISNLWIIKIINREYILKNKYWTKVKRHRNGRIKKIVINKFWYKRISLTSCGRPKTYLVHRLVAQAFIPNPDNKPQVNHKNGIRDDNRIENLERTTVSENVKHSFDVLSKRPVCYWKGKKWKNNHSSKKQYKKIYSEI